MELKLEELTRLNNGSKDLAISDKLSELKLKLEQKQWTELNKHRELISNIIEEELVGRIFYQEGILLKRLSHDPVIAEAKRILASKDRYQKILAKP